MLLLLCENLYVVPGKTGWSRSVLKFNVYRSLKGPLWLDIIASKTEVENCNQLNTRPLTVPFKHVGQPTVATKLTKGPY